MFLSKASKIGSLLAAQGNLAALPRVWSGRIACGVWGNRRDWLIDVWKSPEVFPYIQHSGLEIVMCLQEDESAEAAVARQPKAGSILGFSSQAIDVEFVDAADKEAMAKVFGPLHPQGEAPSVDRFAQSNVIEDGISNPVDTQTAAEPERLRPAAESFGAPLMPHPRSTEAETADILLLQRQPSCYGKLCFKY